MVQVNFTAYGSYVTDSLYQWDIDRELAVTGLKLSVVPEVHFANAIMDRAIVRQATLSSGVVRVKIPNSLLQQPLPICAHIGIYDGDTFKTIEKVAIPVIPRTRPSDYQIQDSDEEIYSFKALENAIANMLTASDLFALEARVDEIIARTGDTDGNTELIDVRVDADGRAYTNAGSAVRGQYEKVINRFNAVLQSGNNLLDPVLCQDNKGVDGSGNIVYNSGFWITDYIWTPAHYGKIVYSRRVYKFTFYDADKNFISNYWPSAISEKITLPDDCKYFIAQIEKDMSNGDNTLFESRYNIRIAWNPSDLYDANGRYQINPESIKGCASALDHFMTPDNNNLFDPLCVFNNKAITTADGMLFESADYWSTNYMSVASVSHTEDVNGNVTLGGIVISEQPYKLAWYDVSFNLIAVEAAIKQCQIYEKPVDARYLVVQFKKEDVAYDERFKVVICDAKNNNVTDVAARYRIDKRYIDAELDLLDIFETDTDNLLNPLKCLRAMGFDSTYGTRFPVKDYWTTDFIEVVNISGIRANVDIYKIGWYNYNKEFVGTGATAPLQGRFYVVLQFDESVVPYDTRFNIVACDSAKELTGVKPYYHLRTEDPRESAVQAIGEYLFKIPLTGTSYMSDHTFINGQLYVINASSDDHEEYAGVTVYNVDLENKTSEYVRTFNHNLGHANSIDYCPETDCLILGNGSSDSSLAGQIYILPNVSSKATWEYNDCIVINIPSLGIKANVVWGEHNNGAYNIAYVITNNNANVRKILLTKTSGSFDGGYIVLGEWSADSIDVNQGSVFRNGKLYTAIGHSQLWVVENILNSDGTITQVQKKDAFYDESGKLLTGLDNPFSEGITIENGYVYVGGSNGAVYVYKA